MITVQALRLRPTRDSNSCKIPRCFGTSILTDCVVEHIVEAVHL